jgi:GAF domain-containing protein
LDDQKRSYGALARRRRAGSLTLAGVISNREPDLRDNVDGDVYQRIADFARSLHGSQPLVTDSVLGRIVEYAVSEIEAAKYAGVTLVTSPTKVLTPAMTHRYPALLDAVQQRHRQGPCLSASWRQHTVRIDDLATDDRWPLYQRDALRCTPIRSVLSFRLFNSDNTTGALNLFADRPHAFDEDAEEIGYVLATHAALAWDTVRREDQFRNALASRDIIGQAKGIVMARFNLDAIQAFELLKRISQNSNTRLVDVARKLTGLKQFDDLGDGALGPHLRCRSR